jgi:hypothetical protein
MCLYFLINKDGMIHISDYKILMLMEVTHNLIVAFLSPNRLRSSLYGRVIAQKVSRWRPTVAARVRSRVWSSGICGEQSGPEAGFLRVLRFPLPIFIPSIAP